MAHTKRMVIDFSGIDIRDGDLAIAIDIIKNKQSQAAGDSDNPDAKEFHNRLLRIWQMLCKIRTSLQECKKAQNS